MHYHVGHNMPGYLPESDVYTYADIDEAIDSLIEELRYVGDDYKSWADEHDCNDIPCPTYGEGCTWNMGCDLELEAECLNDSRESVRVNGDFLIYAAGLAWWLHSCDDDCNTEDEI